MQGWRVVCRSFDGLNKAGKNLFFGCRGLEKWSFGGGEVDRHFWNQVRATYPVPLWAFLCESDVETVARVSSRSGYLRYRCFSSRTEFCRSAM